MRPWMVDVVIWTILVALLVIVMTVVVLSISVFWWVVCACWRVTRTHSRR